MIEKAHQPSVCVQPWYAELRQTQDHSSFEDPSPLQRQHLLLDPRLEMARETVLRISKYGMFSMNMRGTRGLADLQLIELGLLPGSIDGTL